MVSIIPMDPLSIKSDLPLELLVPIISQSDVCSYIVKLNKWNRIAVYNFHTFEIINQLETTFSIYNISVSKCYKFVVISSAPTVQILKISDLSLVQEITVDFVPIYDEERDGEFHMIGSDSNGEPVHTFTINNELLIGCNDTIKKYSFCPDTNTWTQNHKFILPTQTTIVKITANLTTNTFACGTLGGSVYVFDLNTRHLITDFTTCTALMRSDTYPEILSITFNQNILVVSSASGNNIIFNLDSSTSCTSITINCTSI